MGKEKEQAQATQAAGVRAYVDDNNVAQFNAEFVARDLGFVEVMKDRAADSCGKFPTAVRWRTVNAYLAEFGYKKKVGKGDFIPENMMYRLAMKASSTTAVKFQMKVANEIMPSIRKYGYYSLSDDEPIKHASPTMRAGQLKPACVYAFLMSDNTVKIGNTADINDRIRRVERLSNLDVLKKYCTPKMPRKQAQVLERKMHKKFAAMRVCGEYFNVPFEEVCAELDKLAAEFAVVEESLPVQVNLFDSPEEIPDIDEPKIKLLVDLCAVPIDSPFKEQLIREAANLILGKKLF